MKTLNSFLAVITFFFSSYASAYSISGTTCVEEFGTCYVGVEFDFFDTWNNANNLGLALGYDLAAIHSQKQNDFITSWLRLKR